MQLIYKIEYNSTNSYYKYIIEQLIKEFTVQAVCKQYKNFILIILNDKPDKIENFFKYLEEKLPLSIFLGKSYVIEEYDKTSTEIEDKGIKQNLCVLTNDIIDNILKNNQIDFFNDIDNILKGKVSRLETRNGLKKFYLPNKIKREKSEAKNYEVKLLITDTLKIEELFDITMKDLQLLCCIERPLVKLKFKKDKNLKKEYSSTNYIYAKLPDDRETVLFADALKKHNIFFLMYTSDEVYQDGLKVTSYKDKNLIIRGNKGHFPKFDVILNKKFNTSKEYFDACGGVYKSILFQYSKRIDSTIGIYFSLKSEDSNISVNIPTKGIKKLIRIPNIYNNINNCFEEITQIDENCERLIKNYEEKYGSTLNKKLDENSNGFESIINICAKVLGMENAKEFEDKALDANFKKGLLIDMKIININDINYLDYRKIVQSIMSYKMAGVESSIIAFSFYESLAEFISSCLDEIIKDIKIKDVILCGDMFSNNILLSRVDRIISNNYNLIIPIKYPMDY